jgi:hypothetical protein
MALGEPVVNIPRGATYDSRAVSAAFDATNKRILAIEKILNDLPAQTLSAVLQILANSDNGFVVKKGDRLITRALDAGAGVSVKNGDGQKGDTIISAP